MSKTTRHNESEDCSSPHPPVSRFFNSVGVSAKYKTVAGYLKLETDDLLPLAVQKRPQNDALRAQGIQDRLLVIPIQITFKAPPSPARADVSAREVAHDPHRVATIDPVEHRQQVRPQVAWIELQ